MKNKLKKIDYFSFSQFMTISLCQLNYYYRYIVKIRPKEKPSQIFGKVIHHSLYLMVKNKIVTDKDALKIYNSNWIDFGYDSLSQKKDYYKAGKLIMVNFIKKTKKEPLNILKINNRLAIEKKFIFNFKKNKLKGKIDRIDLINNGVEIIDYKTGLMPKKLIKDNKNQLFFYSMVARDLFGLIPQKLTYYYLNEDKKLSFLPDKKEEEFLIDKINEKIKIIHSGKFKASPGWNCKNCEFRSICNSAV
jgi:RecB family exonuclease